ncbi:hypothetical protein RO3G_11644 [Rhizopus delemar RA 99-880]|uniref:Uncharacterized protein n=1 Tax=Rhizopus delemar (strain RA 99-880 / ATCC MYA-4621 / FGSC 9543 / NRRL 43880) TaxID=246409 RepID=I1CEQ3_RHIO9|nr:hypothetical protein RO3G_11644 [Rhizopus delemar RA 99-880]|eukprot:EIE86933.1 hypothetical protein RO3G_11644 [Rhizopus delemar RA 99-880]
MIPAKLKEHIIKQYDNGLDPYDPEKGNSGQNSNSHRSQSEFHSQMDFRSKEAFLMELIHLECPF